MSLIKITSFAKAKQNGGSGGTNTTSKGFTTTIKKNLDMHYLWGQPFDGTQDVNGDMAVEGNINVTGTINAEGDITTTSDIHADGISSNTIQTGTIDADNGNITTVNSTNVNTTNVNATTGDIENLISDNGEIQNLNVDVLDAKQAHFWELVIDKMRSTNGTFILSPANAKIEKVVEDTTNGTYQLMWRATDIYTNKAITNDFEVNDQIICLSFNQAEVGNNYNVDNKYYWAKVTSKGTTTAYDDLRQTTCDWHYITVGGEQVTWDGTLNPEVGDEICVLGNTTDPTRQNAIILSSTNSTFLDEDLEAPSIAQYKGISTFELKPYRLNCLSGNENTFYGNFNVVVGNSTSDVKDLINDSKSNIASIQTDSLMTFIMADSNGKIDSLTAATGLVKKIEVYLGNNIIPTSEWQDSCYVKWRDTQFYPIETGSEHHIYLLREGIDIDSFTQNANDVQVNWTYHGENPTEEETTQETTPTDTECSIYIEFIHNGTTYQKMFNVPATVIRTEKGTDAEFDKLVVDTFKAVVTLDDKLQIQSTAYVQHIKGNTMTRQDVSGYWLDAVSNAGDRFNFNKNDTNTYFLYNNNNYIINYSEQANTQKYYTVRLFQGTKKIDEMVFAVTFDSGAIFQVKEDAITSAVTQSNAYTDGQITTVNTDISRIEQTASQISSRVTNIENDYVTSSELTQTANNIQLNVYNELNEKTGIDVSNGTITLDADNTTIVGNLNIKDSEQGIVIMDEYNNPKITIQNETLGNLDDFDFGSTVLLSTKTNTTVNTQNYAVTMPTVNIGSLSAGQNLTLTEIKIKSNNMQNYFDTAIVSISYTYIIKCGTTTVTRRTGNATLDDYEWIIPDLTLNLTLSGNYTIDISFYATLSDTTYFGDFIHNFYFRCTTIQPNINKIATDGAVFASNTTKFNWFGPDQTMIRNGNTAIRLKDGQLQRNVYETNDTYYNNTFGDISSILPYRYLNQLTYTATLNDAVIIYSSVVGSANSAQRTLYLPRPSICPGKIYYIKNTVGNNTRIYVSGATSSDYYFMQADSSSTAKNLSIGDNSCMLISCLYNWVLFYCG